MTKNKGPIAVKSLRPGGFPILAIVNGGNTKLDGIPSWTVGTTKKEAVASCSATHCDFRMQRDGGQAGRFKIMQGPARGQYLDVKQTRVRSAATDKKPEVREDQAGNLVEKVPICFALYGTEMFAMAAKNRAGQRDLDRYSLETVLENRSIKHKYVRGATVGNPSTGLSQGQLAKIDSMIRAEGLGHILYDHAWRTNPWVLEYACASANHWPDVADALALGAKVVTVTVPNFDGLPDPVPRFGEVPVIKCLEQTGAATCNSCGLCDVQKRSKRTPQIVVLFEQHDTASHNRKKGNARRAVAGLLGKHKAEEALDDGTITEKLQKLLPDAGKNLTKRLHRYINWFSG